MVLKLMTLNVRYGTANDGEHIWTNRRAAMFEMLQTYAPDVLGVQEALRFQLDELLEALPGCACFGEARYGLDDNEHSAIFYRQRTIYCLEGHTFWLSETPEVPGSQSWESSLPRLATIGRFQRKADGKPFTLCNTHFDHRSELARQKSAKLIWDCVQGHRDATFITGDFNCTENSAAWKYLTQAPGDFVDVWHAAEKRVHPVSTYHRYRGLLEENVRIDWILMRPQMQVPHAETVVYQREGFYPSDHFAVFARIDF